MKIDITPYMETIKDMKKPFYLYDSKVLKNQINNLVKNLPEIIKPFYSMKANPNINIVRLLNNQGAGIEIASKGELIAALSVGVLPENIVFAGPAKTKEELEFAISNNIYAINAESIVELERINRISKDMNKKQRVNLRINPIFSIEESILQMGGGAMKFGIDEEQIIDFKDKITGFSWLNIEGIHVFAATQVLKEKLLVEYFNKAIELFLKIEDILGKELSILDIGSGFGIDYEHKGRNLNLENLGKEFNKVLLKYDFLLSREKFEIIIESGRYLTGESGVYITEVIDRKKSRDKNFALVKGGINHLMRPALIDQSHKVEVISKKENSNLEKVSIGGQLCTGIDFFVEDELLPETNIGDIIVIYDCGAYGYTESMLYFLSHDSPGEYIIYDEEIYQIRNIKNSCFILSEQIDLKGKVKNNVKESKSS